MNSIALLQRLAYVMTIGALSLYNYVNTCILPMMT